MVKYYNGWEISSEGGFCTIKRYVARKEDLWHWAFRLKDCKQFCDMRDNGGIIEQLYLKPLYI